MKQQQIKDGWHMIAGYTVYVKDGIVIRGILGDGNTQRTAYPYRAAKHGGWDLDEYMTVAAFRAGVARGTVIMA